MVRRDSRFTSLAVSCCLLFLLAACGPFGSADSGSTPTASTSGRTATPTTGVTTSTPTTGGATSTSTTVPMPATQTACPTAGTARAAVFAPLVLGSHQNIVYTFNYSTAQGVPSGEIKRYDATTGKKFIIVNAPTNGIFVAQISPDGQWILFTTDFSSTEVALQLARMDGQGLQTLYCSPIDSLYSLSSIEWSPDQKTVAFMDGVRGVDLLDLATGHLQVVLVEPTVTTGSILLAPATWLDVTHIYIASFVNGNNRGSQGGLYALDTAKGAHQQVSDLTRVFDYSGYCLSFDSSVDNSKLFVSTCHAIQQGPGTIIAGPALGGPQTMVYSNPTLAITAVRVVSNTTMLLLIQNSTGDTSHNGLWKLNLDGTVLTRLTTAGAGQSCFLNPTSQFRWSNISRNGSMYALKIGSAQTESLLIGSLGGTSSSTFATVSGGGVSIVGWTTM
jgi:eukaryotic-like serine/threonine-protein kinase